MQRSVAPCSFTLLFDMPTVPQDQYHDENTLTDSSYTYHSSSSSSCSSPVDCTLSLGPSSTRQSNGTRKSPQRATATATTTCMPAFRWDIFSQSKHNSVTTPTAKNNATSSGSLSGGGGDPLLARRCANCDTTSTPLWRNGPRGPKSLCNACGIRYKKEERRAAATTMSPYGSSSSPSPMASETQKPQQQTTAGYGYNPHQHDGNLWGYTAPSSHRSSSMSLSSGAGGEFRFSHGYDSNADSPEDGALPPYLSWCLNVPQPRAEYLHHY